MSVTGPRDEAQGGAYKVGVPIADLMAGMYASSAVLAALLHRNKTGEGQYIDMALLDVQVGFLANQNMNYLVTGKLPRRMGNAHPNIVPYQTFDTADGAINLGVGNDGQFAKFCSVAGLDELVANPLYATHSARIDNRETLVSIVAHQMVLHTSGYWNDALNAAGVPCGSVNNISEVFRDPQVESRHMKISLPHPVAGRVDLVANPIKFSKTPIRYEAPPPTLGEHTEVVLAELLGLDAKELEKLRAQGVV